VLSATSSEATLQIHGLGRCDTTVAAATTGAPPCCAIGMATACAGAADAAGCAVAVAVATTALVVACTGAGAGAAATAVAITGCAMMAGAGTLIRPPGRAPRGTVTCT
jgi:hypothetical protein